MNSIGIHFCHQNVRKLDGGTALPARSRNVAMGGANTTKCLLEGAPTSIVQKRNLIPAVPFDVTIMRYKEEEIGITFRRTGRGNERTSAADWHCGAAALCM